MKVSQSSEGFERALCCVEITLLIQCNPRHKTSLMGDHLSFETAFSALALYCYVPEPLRKDHPSSKTSFSALALY